MQTKIISITHCGVCQALTTLESEEVRAGKYMEIRINEDDNNKANKQINDMCHKLLANPVIEDYRFELEKA